MFYYLGESLVARVGAFNVLTYITVRAGGAALFAFLITLPVSYTHLTMPTIYSD